MAALGKQALFRRPLVLVVIFHTSELTALAAAFYGILLLQAASLNQGSPVARNFPNSMYQFDPGSHVMEERTASYCFLTSTHECTHTYEQ